MLIDSTVEEPLNEYEVLIEELSKFSELLKEKVKVIAFTKSDLLSEEDKKKLSELKVKNYDNEIFVISAVAHGDISHNLSRQRFKQYRNR